MKKIVLSLLTLGCLCPLFAEGNDTGMGIELGASHKVAKGTEISIDGEFRTQDGLGQVERWAIGANLDYKINKHLKANVGYTLLGKRIPDEETSKYRRVHYWSPRHRAFASLTADWKLGKHWNLSWRERYQYTYEAERFVKRYALATGMRGEDKVVGDESEQLLRSRLQLKWGRKKCAWEPFLNIEMLNDLSDGLALDQMRYTAGTDYKLNKQNSLGLSYRYKDKNDKDEAKGHLFTLKYAYEF